MSMSIDLQKWEELCEKYVECYGKPNNLSVNNDDNELHLSAECLAECDVNSEIIDTLKELLGVESSDIRIKTWPFCSDYITLSINCKIF